MRENRAWRGGRPRGLVGCLKFWLTGAPLPATADAWRLGLLTGVWLLLVLAGLAGLLMYASRPGPRGEVPGHWPRETELPRTAGRWTLLVFAHPKCPCTHATLDELASLSGRCSERLECQVLFTRPAGQSSEWARTACWRKAARIPGVRLTCDVAGREARRFGARTSGHVLLFDPDGRLRFDGGITPYRGHRGETWGQRRIVSLVREDGRREDGRRGDGRRGGPTAASTGRRGDGPVQDRAWIYGCPLFAPANAVVALPEVRQER